jgi:uncharacterized membrane protein
MNARIAAAASPMRGAAEAGAVFDRAVLGLDVAQQRGLLIGTIIDRFAVRVVIRVA